MNILMTLSISRLLQQQWFNDSMGYAEALYDFVLSNLVLSAFVVLIVSAAGVVTAHYAIRFFESESDRFLRTIEDCEMITVLMHDNPDPDAMASAMAVRRLAQIKGVETEIAYPGRIAHDENRAFRAVLNIEFNNINHAGELNGEKIVLVDQTEPRGVENGDTIIPSAVIDHHSSNGKTHDKIEFWHVDEDVGSCSSILTEFLDQQDLISSDPEKTEISENLATALYHGIKSDTDDISRGVSDMDFRAVNMLYSNIDEEKLYRISNPKVDESSLETKARAIMGRDVRGPFAVSDVGDVQNTDSIPQAADELIRLEGISATVVIGLCNDSIRISGRAYDDRIHLGQALEKAVREITSEGGAGGHAELAGGQIPKTALDSSEYSRGDIIEKMFDAMNGD